MRMDGKRIVETLLKDIMAGVFSETAKLPSEAALGRRFGVARMTVRNALSELQRRGLIEKRNGAGSFLTRRALRKSGVIGLVIPDIRQFKFFSAIHEELLRHCARLNYRVELVTTDETDRNAIVADIRHKVRRLATLRAEGVVFRPYVSDDFARANAEIVRILRHAEIPVVLVDADIIRPPERSDCDLVTVDNIAAGRRIANHLHGKGCRHIAFLSDGNTRKMNTNWSNRLFGLAGELALLGAENAVRALSIPPDDDNAVAAALRRRPRPDAIVCGNDEQAAALMATLKRLGKHVPEDVSVVGFDDLPLARSTQPPLTTVSQPVLKIASAAFKLLLARIRYPNNDPREIHLVAPFVRRGSA